MPDLIVKRAKMFLCFLGRHRGEKLVEAAKAAGARGGTLALGQSLENSRILRALSLADVQQDVLFMVIGEEEAAVLAAVKEAAAREPRKFAGMGLMIEVPELFLPSGSSSRRLWAAGKGGGEKAADPKTPGPIAPEKPPSRGSPAGSSGFGSGLELTPARAADAFFSPRSETMDVEYKMIVVIVNSGCADDVMAAARKAGATGGTVMNARGTGTQEDVKFFGITLVPEKEMLFIVSPRKDAAGIVEAIGRIPVLTRPGGGIMFSLDVSDFFLLGQNKGWHD